MKTKDTLILGLGLSVAMFSLGRVFEKSSVGQTDTVRGVVNYIEKENNRPGYPSWIGATIVLGDDKGEKINFINETSLIRFKTSSDVERIRRGLKKGCEYQFHFAANPDLKRDEHEPYNLTKVTPTDSNEKKCGSFGAPL